MRVCVPKNQAFVVGSKDESCGKRSNSISNWIFAERLKNRGHEVFVISVSHSKPSLRQQAKSLLRGRGWISTPQNEPSFFDNLSVEHKITERCRPIEDKDVPDADVVVATWWETAEWVAKLSPSKGGN